MGITQHSRGTANVQQIANLLLLKGNFGKPGAGICPLRGHSNAQGNRTVGITEKPNIPMFEGIERTFGFKPPRHHGHDSVAAMEAIDDGRSKVLICLGGNFAVALPDPERCQAGMRKLELAVHLGTKLNRSHLLVGKQSIILPVLGRTERDIQASGPQAITVEDSMSMVHASRGRLNPASEHLRSESAIVAGMAMATLPASKVPWAELSPITTASATPLKAYSPILGTTTSALDIPAVFACRCRRRCANGRPLPARRNSSSSMAWKRTRL
jgi:anaerobic selenocysteine-containing dehydrogenase